MKIEDLVFNDSLDALAIDVTGGGRYGKCWKKKRRHHRRRYRCHKGYGHKHHKHHGHYHCHYHHHHYNPCGGYGWRRYK